MAAQQIDKGCDPPVPLEKQREVPSHDHQSMKFIKTESVGGLPTQKPYADRLAAPADRVITISVGVQGSLLVWDPLDAIVLQRNYRIQGASMGMHPRVPVQDAFMSLPIALMPEEGAYLRDKQQARFEDESSLVKMPTLMDVVKFHDARKVQVSQQDEIYDKLRPRHFDLHRDVVYSKYLRELQEAAAVEGVKLPESPDDLWELLRARLLAHPDLQNQVVNVELPTRSWRAQMGGLKMAEIAFHYPETSKERCFYAAYAALMDRGFSVTSGSNYGADFLAFKGDPHLVYSSYMVKVINVAEGDSLDDYLRLGRVATTAKKALLWVMVSEDLLVEFCCSKWSLMK
ncbi:hypothetical protein BV898_06428 [Hypsibius exemplaris]|uniref:tRNA-intron lyase n=1 Tax=Hypsibius exemplaris TaxID=2072580 RepID=A0A1W0WWX0_HYPEX|nr:hypothetical protein BV898_06428 [Hypsibius exemplaris]